ncbi:OLC1v1016321C1, partial [Oldenlandia corymbosa var. corymbosa]
TRIDAHNVESANSRDATDSFAMSSRDRRGIFNKTSNSVISGIISPTKTNDRKIDSISQISNIND